MTIEIDNNLLSQSSVLTNEVKKSDPALGQAKAKVQVNEESTIKESSLTLQAVHEKMAQTPIVDSTKVEMIKHKIASGELDILHAKAQDSALRIAEKMLNLEEDLFSSKR